MTPDVDFKTSQRLEALERIRKSKEKK